MSEKKISSGTIIRTICLGLAMLNMILKMTGHEVLPISDDEINAFVTDGAVMITAVVAWWKNNSFSHAALNADSFKSELKAASKANRGDE